MNEEPVSGDNRPPGWRKWLIRLACGYLVLAFLAAILGQSVVLFDLPFQVLAGWAVHAGDALPPLLHFWRALLVPLLCLLLATWLVHRFIGWARAAKGLPPSWRPAQTFSAIALFILNCAAAIAISGVAHQSVWLLGDPWFEDRGKKAELTYAVSNARQLSLVLFEFHSEMGRYPISFDELGAEIPFPKQFLWVETKRGSVKEPMILLYPGREREANADEPLAVSPIIESAGKFVVLYGDGSASSKNREQFNKVLEMPYDDPLKIPRGIAR